MNVNTAIATNSEPEESVHFNEQQVMLTLSYIAYYGFGLDGSDQRNAKLIAIDIESALNSWRPVKEQWSLVWGPGIFRFRDDCHDDNLMFVVQHLTTGDYVVAVRGTNPLSIRDWLFEDFDVARMAPWPTKSQQISGKPKISRATLTGLNHLLEMKPEVGIAGEGQTLLEFLQTRLAESPSSRVCVTGHSLGGALAPTLALWLKERQGESLPLDLQISTYAFAGPTAGNADFARYSDQLLGEECMRVVNSLDVVPHAWNTKDIRKLFFLYDRHLLFPSPVMIAEITLMLVMSFGRQYTQISGQVEEIPGKYKHLIYNYFAQAVYQHTAGYLDILGLDKEMDIPITQLFSGQLEL